MLVHYNFGSQSGGFPPGTPVSPAIQIYAAYKPYSLGIKGNELLLLLLLLLFLAVSAHSDLAYIILLS